MKLINCVDCGIELNDDTWYPSWKARNQRKCKSCVKIVNDKFNPKNNPKNNPRNNPQRMYVNGKYIPKSHPLYKPGRYKTFEDAAFQSLSRYTTSTEGEVYIITNPAWNGWIKVGMAVEAEDRCKGYQTSSPLRDYKLEYKKYFNDRRQAENIAHALCAKKAEKKKGEWFKLSLDVAIKCIDKINIEKNNDKKEKTA